MFESRRRKRSGPGRALADGARRAAESARRAAGRVGLAARRTREIAGRARDLTWGRLGPRGKGAVLVSAAALIGLGGGLAWGTWTHICADCPSIAQIYAFEPKQATRVYARDSTLLAEFALERRAVVPYDSLPSYVPEAFVAVEDRRFWEHGGVDLRRTARAAVMFLFRGYDVQGGSTITQQLAGNMFPESVDRRVLSIRRKLKEMRVALALERAYPKREILGAYLNQINFGDGHYGIQSASHYYFGKDATALGLADAALLAALPRAPATYSPIRHPERALQRRNLVLDLMARQGKVTRRQAEAAKAHPLAVRRGEEEPRAAPYFVEWIRRKMYRRFGRDIYEAGYRVYTTLNPELQQVADSALHAQLRWVEGQRGFRAPTYQETRSWAPEKLEGEQTPYVQGAFLALDPRTGDVLAMIGGRDFSDSEFNRATQARRQPGSVFKGFVYTAAIAAGIPASEIIYDTATEFVLPDSTIYAPENFGGEFRGPVTMREALYRSINVVAVKVGNRRVGLESVAQYASRMGIETPIPRVPSMPIGSASVIPLQVARAYTPLATLGDRVAPRGIRRVETRDGQVIWRSPVERERVVERPVAWIVNDMLQDVVDRGTGVAVRRRGLPDSIPAAGKTGTTNEATNAWFVGFTPEILTTTWVGFDERRRIHFNAQGGLDAAPVGAEVLTWYYRDRPAPAGWQRPDEIESREVDRNSGLLATPWCPADSTYVEYYLPGSEPVQSCDLHGPFTGERD